jgi:hypothetical protein
MNVFDLGFIRDPSNLAAFSPADWRITDFQHRINYRALVWLERFLIYFAANFKHYKLNPECGRTDKRWCMYCHSRICSGLSTCNQNCLTDSIHCKPNWFVSSHKLLYFVTNTTNCYCIWQLLYESFSQWLWLWYSLIIFEMAILVELNYKGLLYWPIIIVLEYQTVLIFKNYTAAMYVEFDRPVMALLI